MGRIPPTEMNSLTACVTVCLTQLHLTISFKKSLPGPLFVSHIGVYGPMAAMQQHNPRNLTASHTFIHSCAPVLLTNCYCPTDYRFLSLHSFSLFLSVLQLQYCSPKDLATMIWSLSHMQLLPPTPWLLRFYSASQTLFPQCTDAQLATLVVSVDKLLQLPKRAEGRGPAQQQNAPQQQQEQDQQAVSKQEPAEQQQQQQEREGERKSERDDAVSLQQQQQQQEQQQQQQQQLGPETGRLQAAERQPDVPPAVWQLQLELELRGRLRQRARQQQQLQGRRSNLEQQQQQPRGQGVVQQQLAKPGRPPQRQHEEDSWRQETQQQEEAEEEQQDASLLVVRSILRRWQRVGIEGLAQQQFGLQPQQQDRDGSSDGRWEG